MSMLEVSILPAGGRSGSRRVASRRIRQSMSFLQSLPSSADGLPPPPRRHCCAFPNQSPESAEVATAAAPEMGKIREGVDGRTDGRTTGKDGCTWDRLTGWMGLDIAKAKGRSQKRDLIAVDCAFSERVSVGGDELARVNPLQAFLLSASVFVVGGGSGTLCQFSCNFYLCELMCSCGLHSLVVGQSSARPAPARNADASLTTDERRMFDIGDHRRFQ